MKPQRLSVIIIALTLAAIAVVLAPVLAPKNAFSKRVTPKLGLDIQGGARVVLEAQIEKLSPDVRWNDDTRAAVLRTIENRVNANGVAEPVIIPKGDHQYVVEIPSVKNNQEIVEQLLVEQLVHEVFRGPLVEPGQSLDDRGHAHRHRR